MEYLIRIKLISKRQSKVMKTQADVQHADQNEIKI